MFTLDTLPRNGVLRIYGTADHYTPESLENGTPETNGWVDSLDSRSIQESRNDVRPLVELHVLHLLGGGATVCLTSDPNEADMTVMEMDADARDEIGAVLSRLGAYQTDSGATLYAVDESPDYATGEHWMYAIHAHVKHYDALRGWVEDDVDITAH